MTGPVREEKIHDVKFLVLFCAAIGVLIQIIYDANLKGRPEVYIRGHDSFGNICGRKNNKKYEGVALSGLDKSEATYQLFLSYAKFDVPQIPGNKTPEALIRKAPERIIKTNNTGNENILLCVKECPKAVIRCEDFLTANGYDITKISQKVVTENICKGLPYNQVIPHRTLLTFCAPDLKGLVS